MRSVTSATFDEPPLTNQLQEEPLIIHSRPAPSESQTSICATKQASARHLAIFVHGLGGSRYGRKATWGHFPSLLFEDFNQLDIGMYEYRTLFRRIRFTKSIELEREASVLGDLLVSLTHYEHFILLGHSLGGILCKGVVAYLLHPERQETLHKLSGLFLMATPQLGSTMVPSFLSIFSSDARALRPHGTYLSTLAQAFQDHIDTRSSYTLDDKVAIPCWALLAAEDNWVDALSAGIALDVTQKRIVRGSHTSIVKPRARTDDGYRFIYSCFKKTLNASRSQHQNRCTPAAEDDLSFIHEFATSLFGQDVSELALMRQWRKQNSGSFWILKRTTSVPGRKLDDIAGYFCLLPITMATAESIRAGKMKGSSIPIDSILPDGEKFSALYIGAIAGRDPRAKLDVMLALTTHLYTLKKDGPVTVLTRPVTADGLRVVVDYEMVPSDPANTGIGRIYEFQL